MSAPSERHDALTLDGFDLGQRNSRMLDKSSKLMPRHLQMDGAFAAGEHDTHSGSIDFKLVQFIDPNRGSAHCLFLRQAGECDTAFIKVKPEEHSVNSTFVEMAS